MNKYYEMFISENIDDSILKVNNRSLSFEDHFWHFACLSIYYKKKKDFYMHKKCLTAACDLNYYYNALIYFDAFKVLPNNFKKYVTKFEHKMVDEKLENLIKDANKQDKKSNFKGFLLYSSISLLVIPIMLLLVFVFKMDTTTATVVSIIGLLLGQGLVSPMQRQNKEMKQYKRDSLMTKEEKSYFDFNSLFYNLLKDPKLIALIKAENEEEQKIIVNAIQKNKPLPEDIVNKQSKNKSKKTKKDK